MNTKKDYERAAKIVRDMRLNDSDANADAALGAFVDFFALGNPRFDSERFREACEVPAEHFEACAKRQGVVDHHAIALNDPRSRKRGNRSIKVKATQRDLGYLSGRDPDAVMKTR